MRRHRQPWTEERKAALAELWTAGASTETIAAALGCSAKAVYRYRYVFGLPGRPWAHGRARAPSVQRFWTPAEEDRLTLLWRSGKTDAGIGAALDRAAGSIRNHRQLLGLVREPVEPAEIERWRRMQQRGIPLSAIARRASRGYRTVCRLLEEP